MQVRNPATQEVNNHPLIVQLFQPPQPEPLALKNQAQAKPAAPQSETVKKKAPPADITQSQAPPASVAPAAPAIEPKDEPAASAPLRIAPSELIQNAIRDVGKIDQDLRKGSRKLLELAPVTTQSKLEKGIAAAGRPVAITMENFTLADGRRMTKVIGPNGTYCVTTDSIGLTRGLDVMQNGVQSRTTNCPS